MVRSASKQIGILGGTFNPIHDGHIYIALRALGELDLRKVIFVPAYIPPHKKIHGNAKTKDRIKMLRLALRGRKKFALSLYEINKKERSYSIKTAKFLKKKLGKKTKLFFLIGADSLSGLKKWKDFSNLSKLVQFVVISRPGFMVKNAPAGVIKINAHGKNVSSTEIRRKISKGQAPKGLVPGVVSLYIKAKGLYGA